MIIPKLCQLLPGRHRHLLQESQYEYLQAVGCNDPSIQLMKDSSQSDCEAACDAELTCGAFTFNKQTRTCFLKEACDTRKEKQENFSGIKKAKPQPEFETLWTTLCRDPSMVSYSGLTKPACEAACADDGNCQAYTFHYDSGRCLLKETCTIREWKALLVTGIKKSVPPPQLHRFKILWAQRCQDPVSLMSLPGLTRPTCQAACAEQNDCGAYTFDYHSNICLLTETCETKTWSERHVTGLKIPPEPPAPVCKCDQSLLSNGKCDAECNTVECLFDGKDCMPPGPFSGKDLPPPQQGTPPRGMPLRCHRLWGQRKWQAG